MKRLMMLAVLVAGQLGCVSNQGDASMRFLNARGWEFDTSTGVCKSTAQVFITRGSYDVSGGKDDYLLSMQVETNNRERAVAVNQVPYTNSGPSDVTLTELIYSYAVPAGAKLPTLPKDEEDRVSIYAVYRPNSSPTESYLTLSGLGPMAIQTLRSGLSTDADDVVLSVTIKARGRLSSGQSVESNEIIFPITVVNSGFNNRTGRCENGLPPSLAGTCGRAGQDNGRICPKSPSL